MTRRTFFATVGAIVAASQAKLAFAPETLKRLTYRGRPFVPGLGIAPNRIYFIPREGYFTYEHLPEGWFTKMTDGRMAEEDQ